HNFAARSNQGCVPQAAAAFLIQTLLSWNAAPPIGAMVSASVTATPSSGDRRSTPGLEVARTANSQTLTAFHQTPGPDENRTNGRVGAVANRCGVESGSSHGGSQPSQFHEQQPQRSERYVCECRSGI